MKNIREIITDLNVARSNSCSKEKSEEIKGIINDLLPYAEIEEELGINLIKFFMGFKKNVRIYYKKGKKIKEGIMTLGILQKYGKTWALTKEELLCQK